MLIERLGRWFLVRAERVPWTPLVGTARTLLALGTLGTLLATPERYLLSPIVGSVTPPACIGPARAALWCVVPQTHRSLALWVAVVVLAWAASGWLPRWSAVLHWWVSWSFISNLTVQDGGDQITAVLTLLLVPLLLTDRRRWHWQVAHEDIHTASPTRWVLAYAALGLIALQVAGLYLQAAISKLGVAEWADGSAMFYWFNNSIFGAPPYLKPLTNLLTGSPVLVVTLTWGSLAIEFALGIAIVLGRPAKRVLLLLGLVFHDTIALTMGLISFDLAMAGALLLYLVPTEDVRSLLHGLSLPRWRRRPSAQPAASPPTHLVRANPGRVLVHATKEAE